MNLRRIIMLEVLFLGFAVLLSHHQSLTAFRLAPVPLLEQTGCHTSLWVDTQMTSGIDAKVRAAPAIDRVQSFAVICTPRPRIVSRYARGLALRSEVAFRVQDERERCARASRASDGVKLS